MIEISECVPRWEFTTDWIRGKCRVDRGDCEYQVHIRKLRWTGSVRDVTELQECFRKIVESEPTTAEELFLRLSYETTLSNYRISVRCRSSVHGILECGHL